MLTVTAATGIATGAAPAGAAATGATATLSHGTLTVTGTATRDVIDVTMGHRSLSVDFGFDGTVDARFLMSRVQRLSVFLGGGNDGLTVIGAGVGDVPTTIDAGAGNDAVGVVGLEDALLAGDAPVTIRGDGGNDNLSASVPGSAQVAIHAGPGDDVVSGGDGSIGPEAITLGDGNDRFIDTFDAFSAPFRARTDAIAGGTGRDILEMRGTFESEALSLSADAGHLIALHDGRDRISAEGIEDVSWFGLGGNDEGGGGDTVTVRDLSGTGVVNVTPDFSNPNDPSAPNNSSDTLTVVGTPGDDHIVVSSTSTNLSVTGLTPSVTPVSMDNKDLLQIDTLTGNDTVDTSNLQSDSVQLVVL
jgi:hypothetical protein